MSRVILSRLWYIFPADDQDLRPSEFEEKVTSFLRNLPLEQKLAVLDFLTVQYAAFAKQLEILCKRAVLSQPEHSERAERVSNHLHTLRACRECVQSF